MSEKQYVRKCDFLIDDISQHDAKRFVSEYHYSGGCSNTSVYRHGLICAKGGSLLGVALWLPPTRVAAESVNRDDWRRVLSLSRLAVHPDVGKNGASLLLGGSIRIIKREGKWKSLVTYADDFMGHTGRIYLATNWQYVGHMKGSPRWEDANGRQVSRKSTKSRSNQQMKDLGFRCVGTFGKHKFVMHV